MENNSSFIKVKDSNTLDNLEVCKANKEDIDGIIKVASSVGKEKNNSNKGFLMEDYSKNHNKHVRKFEKDIENSKFFYVIKRNGRVLGFLLGYRKNTWLDMEPLWLFDTKWKGDFNKKSLSKFIILEKIAIRSKMTGQGLGSELFKQFRQDALKQGIKNMFSETILSPKPNYASMEFAMKQKYKLAGIRYEDFKEDLLTTIIYHKKF